VGESGVTSSGCAVSNSFHQTVVGRVGNFRIVGHVIAVFVVPQLFPEVFDFVFYRSTGASHVILAMKLTEEKYSLGFYII
jgi:hypothetical protein